MVYVCVCTYINHNDQYYVSLLNISMSVMYDSQLVPRTIQAYIHTVLYNDIYYIVLYDDRYDTYDIVIYIYNDIYK
jgi:hypothetical protein